MQYSFKSHLLGEFYGGGLEMRTDTTVSIATHDLLCYLGNLT